MKKFKLMVADDNREFCNLIRDYAVVQDDVEFVGAAFDGISALDMIRERKPDIVILDNVMPQLDGIGVLTHLKSFHPSDRPKTVALTS